MSKPSEKVFKILKGFGYAVKVYDETGNESYDPAKGVRFFVSSPNLMVTVLDNEVRLNKSNSVELQDIELLTKQLKNVSREYMMRYSLKVYGKAITPKDFSFEAKIKRDTTTEGLTMIKINEAMLGKLFGRIKTSYQTLGEVKIIYKHKVAVNENSPVSRIRNIKSIALEHAGVRYDYPCVHVDGARAMARHINEGGLFGDLAGTQILETSQKHRKLVEFVKYAKKNKLVSEGNATVYHLIEKKIKEIKSDLREFVSSKDYAAQRQKFEETRLNELQSDRVNQLKDDFTVKHFDAQLEEILPVINNILQEKEDYEKSLMEEIGKGLYINRSFEVPSALTFENTQAKFAYYLEEAANCLESAMVAGFLRQISEKLSENEDLEDFELNALKEAFAKMSRIERSELPTPSVVEQFEDRIQALGEEPVQEAGYRLQNHGKEKTDFDGSVKLDVQGRQIEIKYRGEQDAAYHGEPDTFDCPGWSEVCWRGPIDNMTCDITVDGQTMFDDYLMIDGESFSDFARDPKSRAATAGQMVIDIQNYIDESPDDDFVKTASMFLDQGFWEAVLSEFVKQARDIEDDMGDPTVDDREPPDPSDRDHEGWDIHGRYESIDSDLAPITEMPEIPMQDKLSQDIAELEATLGRKLTPEEMALFADDSVQDGDFGASEFEDEDYANADQGQMFDGENYFDAN